MPWDSNGNFTRSNGEQTGAQLWTAARDAGRNIEPGQHDTHDQDLAAGIAACITRDNQSKPTHDFRPNADAAINLGSTSLRWLLLWLTEMRLKTGNFHAALKSTGLSANRTIELPDSDGVLAMAGEQAFAVGTKMIFAQTAAPSGWVKQTGSSYDNAALRFTTGTASTGGADNFTTVFASGKRTGSTTLTVSQIPPLPHEHTQRADDSGVSGIGSGYAGNWSGRGVQGRDATASSAPGGGGSHDHSLSLNLKYVDAIVASKS